MKTLGMRIWIVFSMLGLSSQAQAMSGLKDIGFSSECCDLSSAMNIAKKAETYCRQHQHPFPDQAADPCQLEKDSVQQYAKEYARAANSETCKEECRAASPN